MRRVHRLDDDVALIVGELDDRVLDHRRARESAVEQIALRAVVAVTDSTRSVTPITASGSVSVSSASRTSRIQRFCSALGRDDRMACVRCVRLPSEKTSAISRARSPRLIERRAHRAGERVDDEQQPLGILEPVLHPLDRRAGQASVSGILNSQRSSSARARCQSRTPSMPEPDLDRFGVERGEGAAGLDAESLDERREIARAARARRACTAR